MRFWAKAMLGEVKGKPAVGFIRLSSGRGRITIPYLLEKSPETDP